METPDNPSRERWIGAVDEANLTVISGWAVDREAPNGCVELEVRTSSGWRENVVAGQYREDLRGADLGNGDHGFRVDISGQVRLGDSISIKFASSGVDLPGTPIRLQDNADLEKDRWRSNIEKIDGDRITGWACDMHDPDNFAELEVWTSAGRQASLLANICREDLRDAGLGNGCHGFIIDLAKFEPRDSAVSIVFAASGAPVTLEPIERASAGASAEVDRWRSSIDSIDGSSIAGWACDMNFPDEAVEIDAYTISGWKQTVIAGGYREDLRDAGLGTGCHAFEIDLS